ncbi:copper-binding protein, partial [Nostoc sp. HG1]|nr:copper-binding protein [Nostoc sp. HG1]
MKIYNHFYKIVIKSLTFPTSAWLQILRRNYVILTFLLSLNFITVTPAMAAN